jgi:spermidine synthase
MFGLMNLGVALLARRMFPEELRGRGMSAAAAFIFLVLGSVFVSGGRTTTWLEDQIYTDPVVLAERTAYQRVVVTRWRDDIRLYLDGNLQVSSTDEYRYHESLVHPAMWAVTAPKNVLILGGGDGMAAREVLKHESVVRVDLVDLDPEITALFSEHPLLLELNGGALKDPRVRIHHQDALRFLEETQDRFDVIVVDLPDPNDEGLSRLYTEGAFRMAGRRLKEGGALVTQATSPFFAPEAFWCIYRTVKSALEGGERDRQVRPMHVNVPSFGEWGFVLAAERAPDFKRVGSVDTRYLNLAALEALFEFPQDLVEEEVLVNTLATAQLARYYRRGWSRFQGP